VSRRAGGGTSVREIIFKPIGFVPKIKKSETGMPLEAASIGYEWLRIARYMSGERRRICFLFSYKQP
jgi:hypothetical protein